MPGNWTYASSSVLSPIASLARVYVTSEVRAVEGLFFLTVACRDREVAAAKVYSGVDLSAEPRVYIPSLGKRVCGGLFLLNAVRSGIAYREPFCVSTLPKVYAGSAFCASAVPRVYIPSLWEVGRAAALDVLYRASRSASPKLYKGSAFIVSALPKVYRGTCRGEDFGPFVVVAYTPESAVPTAYS